MSKLFSLATAFARNRDGSISIVFGISIIVVLGMIGLAVDTSRYYNFSSHMQQALDAAALAGAKMLPDDTATDADITSTAQAYFSEAMAISGVDALATVTPSVSIDRTSNAVEVTGQAQLPAMFSIIVTRSGTVAVNRTARVVFDMKQVELSMVLDITGSMNQNNKLPDLKVAAKDVIDELYAGSLSENGVRIALAPYSASVNAGTLASAVTNVPPTTTCSWVWWKWKCTTVAGVDQDTCVIERTGPNAATDAAPVGADMLPNMTASPLPSRYVCPPATVLPLQGKSQKDTVKATIDSYGADGATAGHIGTAWGWYLISPQWASVLGASAPKAYDDPMVDKAMIIMTDGVFNTSWMSGANTNPTAMSNESYAQFDTLCAAIKSKGIKIFTVGFALNDPRALSELQVCASDTSTFFDAQTGADLKAAFHAIAKKLNTLRVAG
jgi:Flp pilus assembly protein TadG